MEHDKKFLKLTAETSINVCKQLQSACVRLSPFSPGSEPSAPSSSMKPPSLLWRCCPPQAQRYPLTPLTTTFDSDKNFCCTAMQLGSGSASEQQQERTNKKLPVEPKGIVCRMW